MVGINVTRREGGNGEAVELTSKLGISAISSQVNVATLLQGAYYCRVEVDEQKMLSNDSRPFLALDPEVYLQEAANCNDKMFSASESACAVRTISEERVATNPDSFTSHLDITSSVEIDTSTISNDGHQPTDPPSSSSPGRSGGGGTTLQVWIYVLVAVAAVFAMIIIILAIMCVGLCLRRSQSTMDSANCKLPINLVHDIDTSK